MHQAARHWRLLGLLSAVLLVPCLALPARAAWPSTRGAVSSTDQLVSAGLGISRIGLQQLQYSGTADDHVRNLKAMPSTGSENISVQDIPAKKCTRVFFKLCGTSASLTMTGVLLVVVAIIIATILFWESRRHRNNDRLQAVTVDVQYVKDEPVVVLNPDDSVMVTYDLATAQKPAKYVLGSMWSWAISDVPHSNSSSATREG